LTPFLIVARRSKAAHRCKRAIETVFYSPHAESKS
jgi:hypothetical protein